VNTTRLLRRIAKYLDKHSGGRKQTGETAFGLNATGDAQVIRRLRNGAELGPEILRNIDNFLKAAGY
jgi:hypothetical protein